MITSIAIDDEPIALKLIADYASRTEGLELLKTFTNPINALNYLKNHTVDLLFLDIQMPDISGLKFYKSVEQDTMVIFTTAFSEYAVEGFNLSAIDYILKPIEYERFLTAVNKAKDFRKFTSRDSHSLEKNIHVRSEYRLVRIYINDIEYIESFDDLIKIHLSTGNPILTQMSLKAILEILPSDQFTRIHRSFIIHLGRIKSVRNNKIQLQKIELPLGISYKSDFMNWLKLNK